MDEKPIRELKPVVVPAQFFVWGPLLATAISLFTSFMSKGVGMMFGVDPFGSSSSTLQVVVFVLAFIACIAFIGAKVFYEPTFTTYTILADRVEYFEGLWNRHRRTLVFDQVIDVELTEGVLQQTRGAGTVTLVTQQLVSQGEGQLSNRRIALKNVPQPKEVYELIRSLALKKGKA